MDKPGSYLPGGAPERRDDRAGISSKVTRLTHKENRVSHDRKRLQAGSCKVYEQVRQTGTSIEIVSTLTWWLVAGANWLDPDNDDEDAEKYEVAYEVIGLRYTLDSFNRMIYAEYRIDQGTLASGVHRDNEIIIGFRWDFGY